MNLRPTRPTAVRTRAAWALDGRLLALIADGEPDPLAFLDVAEGQPALTREQIEEHVASLDAEALAALVEAAQTEAEGIDPAQVTSEDVDRINLLGDAVEAAQTRQTAIAEEEQQRQQAAQDALARLRRPQEGDGEGEGGDSGDGEGSGDGSGEGDGEHEGERTPEAVAASAPRRLGRRTTALPGPGAAGGMGAGTGNPANRSESSTPLRAQHALVAAAGLDSIGLATGATIDSRQQLGEAFGTRLDAIRRGHGSGADGEHLTVATLRTTYPGERMLRTNRVDENTSNVREATSQEALVAAGQAAAQGGALVAAGGLCAPIEQLYDVPVIGSTARPVRDALANFGADRGGVRWREHVSFGDFAGAVGFWTLDNDAAQGDADTGNNPAPKPCLSVECPDEAEAYVEAITLCLRFSNVSTRFDPEGTAANIAAAQIAHARIAENRLMAQIAALSTTVTSGEVLGAVRDMLTFEDQLLAQYRSFYRLDDAVAIRKILPLWWRNMVRADLARSMGSAYDADLLAAADATIDAWFARRGVNVTYHLDGRPATAAAAGTEVLMSAQAYGAFTQAGAVAAFPAQIESLMWVEGDMLHLDGGTLDLGVVRDSTLVSTNEYKTFSESWEGVAHRGVEAIRGVVTTRPLGMVAGTADTAAILAA